MKKAEFLSLIEAHRTELLEVIKSANRATMESDGRIRTQVYIWDNGTVETLETCGGNEWLQPATPDREMIHVVTVKNPFFDWVDYCCEKVPEDPEERDALRDEVINWLAEEFDASEVLDIAVDDILRDFDMYGEA